MDNKKFIAGVTASILFISAMLVNFEPVNAAITNGDLIQVKLNGGAWTNGNIQDNFTGTGDNIEIGGNNGSTQIPAVEVANQQAMNGYGPGDYIFTQSTIIPGNGANPVWIQHLLNNYGFVLEDKSQPNSQPIYGYYAGSDVYTLSGWYAQPNPYSNPYWYAPGQYVHLAPYAKPYVRIDSVQNGQSLVPGSTVTVTDTNDDPSDDGTGNPDKVPQSGTPSGLIAVWYFNNMGTYVNADVGHSNEQVATYGFTPWQDTYIPAIAPTRSFQITVPSGASGSGMLYLYYVDGIDRYYEASYPVKTAAPASPPSVSITASPTSLPTGQYSVVTATGKNVPNGDILELKDITGDQTFGGSNTYEDGVTGETSLSTMVTANTPETAKYQAYVVNPSTGHVDATSGTVSVTWTSSGNTGGTNGNGGNGPTITLSASPTSLPVGQYTGVTATTSGNMSGDFIEISDLSGAGTFDGSNTFEDGVVGETSLSGPAVSQTPQTVTYQASIINASTGQTVAMSNQVQVTWGGSSGGTGGSIGSGPVSITLNASPTSLQVNQASQLTAMASGNTTGDYIEFFDMSNGYTLNGTNTYTDHLTGETQATVNAVSNVAQTVTYIADVVNASTGAIVAQSNAVQVTWTLPQESIQVTASPTQLDSGQPTTITYQTTNMQPGDKVMLTGVGANPPLEESDTAATDSFVDVRYPTNGQSVTVSYSAVIVDARGQIVAYSNTVSVTWKSTPPTISLRADRTSNQPGQPDRIMYAVSGTWAQGDYVVIKGTGGVDAWNVSNDQNVFDTYTETENPAPGQTVTVHYTGTVYDASGNAISTATLDVNWVNAWTGMITLTASPTNLVTQQSTTLTATLSEPLPAGYTLTIFNETSGQVVDQTSTAGTTTLATQYSEFNPTTDTFYAYVSDPYEHLGNPSNQVAVTWSEISLSASPQLLPAGQSTTLTVNVAKALPSGMYVVIENEATGQMVGVSSGTPYSVSVSEPTAQNDTFVAFLSSNTDTSGAIGQSPPVTVDWYTVQLTATPTHLPDGQATLLHASAANMPSGYELAIINTSTGATVATGEPGQTDLQVYDTKNSPQTDTYEAEVVQPGNPNIPELSVPGYVPPSGDFAVTSTGLYYLNPGSNTWSMVAAVPNQDGTTQYGTNFGFRPTTNVPPVFDPVNNTVYVWFNFGQMAQNGYFYGVEFQLWGFNLTTDSWSQTPVSGYANFISVGVPYEMLADPENGMIYCLVTNATYGLELVQYDPQSGSVSYPHMQYTDEDYDWAQHRYIVRRNYSPNVPLVLDEQNQTLYSTSTDAGWLYNDYYLYYGISSGQAGAISALNQDTMTGVSMGYDPSNGLIYIYNPNDAQVMRSYNPSNGQVQSIPSVTLTQPAQGPMVYDPDRKVMYLETQSGVYAFHPDTGEIDNLSAPAEGTLFYDDDRHVLINYTSSTGNVWAYNGSSWQSYASFGGGTALYIPPHGAPSGTVTSFPYWTFQTMPSYVPTSLFTQPAQNSAEGHGFWVDGSPDPRNGTAWFESTFTTSQTESVTISAPGGVDDAETVWVDGRPVLQTGYSVPVMPAQPGAADSTTQTLTLPPGVHQVLVEASNTNGFNNPAPNPAVASVLVTDQNGNTLVGDQGSDWLTTGYVTQLPAGWFSGAIGTFSFNEYVMGEFGTPVTQSASYTVTTPAANVALQSPQVSVTWYGYGVTLQASPTTLDAGSPTTLTVTSTLDTPSTAVLQILDETTGNVVGTSSQGAVTYMTSYARSTAGTESFVGELVDPSSGQIYAQTDPVQVTWNQAKLTLSDAEVYHTPAWQQNLENYNNYYTNIDPQPQLVRSESDFWAGEDLLFKVKPSITDIAQAYVYLPAISMNPMMPPGSPINWTSPPPISLTYNPSDGYLEGGIPTAWDEWLQYMQDGTYTVTFWVKSTDNQVATAQASFTIRDTWVSGNDPGTYFHEHQTW
ncbi:hypothetical protein [Alicyclobacillus mali (ex Roth et al. 2021)]|uniref:hypothetical protein n=1 Tax=Alicyclobacillus mali (ex Roth et al. 2021) TaxID=1123961 RepID=UPI001A8E7F32|nr:hypothetical protein [Alicyclobacillus mali (ex Roth et al. 2021)]